MSAESVTPISSRRHEPLPDQFLTVRLNRIDLDPSLTAVCAGYESGQWRASDLADHMIEWIPDFGLSYSERQRLNSATCVAQTRRAIQKIFGSKSTEYSGAPGELLLHIVCRSVFHSDTAVSKVFFKTGENDEVKGSDCVHIVDTDDGLELWLGEAKCYTERSKAIADAVVSIRKHIQSDCLRSEFGIITDLIDDSWPHAMQLRRLISRNTSLDQIFQRVTIPVLVAYDSRTVRDHHRECDEFLNSFRAEMMHGWQSFASQIGRPDPFPVQVRLFLAPLATKKDLVRELDRRLLACR